MQRLMALFNVFQYGSAVVDPASWKKKQVAVNAFVGLLYALSTLAVSQGWIPQAIDEESLLQVSEGVVLVVLAVINILGTWATSTKVGVGRKPPMPQPPGSELHEPPYRTSEGVPRSYPDRNGHNPGNEGVQARVCNPAKQGELPLGSPRSFTEDDPWLGG